MRAESQQSRKRPHHSGSLFRRRSDGLRVVRVSLGTDAKTGKRLRVTKYARNATEAKAALRHLHLYTNPYADFHPGSPLGDFFARWFQIRMKPALKELSYQRAWRIFENHVLPHLGTLPLNEATPDALGAYMTRLEKLHVGAVTRRLLFTYLRLAFKSAKRWGLIETNPMEELVMPQTRRRPITVLGEDEMARLLHHAASSRLYALHVLALVTGMRRSELLGLQFRDYDERAGLLHVRRSAICDNGKWYISDTLKTGNGRRAIRLPRLAIQSLGLHRRRMEREGYTGVWMFGDAGGVKPLSEATLYRSFRLLCKRAGVAEGFTFHGFRHTSVTTSLRVGVHPKAVAVHHGQAVKTTINTYSHLLPGDDEIVADKLSRAFAALERP